MSKNTPPNYLPSASGSRTEVKPLLAAREIPQPPLGLFLGALFSDRLAPALSRPKAKAPTDFPWKS
jgi:hypothetical protein